MAADVDDVRALIAVFCLFVLSLVNTATAGLYSPQDGIEVFNSSNLKGTIHGSESAWVVEFYSSWCGHCVKFAPHYKELADSVAGWKSVMRVGAIDCAEEANTAACRDYKIDMFPSLLFFKPNSPVDDIGDGYNGNRSVSDIQDKMLQWIEKLIINGTTAWSHLAPLKSLELIWEDAVDPVEHTAIIFEEAGSRLGLHVMLDLLSYKKLLLRRILKESVAKYGVNEFPAIYLLDKGGTFKKIAVKKPKDQFVAAIKRSLNLDGDHYNQGIGFEEGIGAGEEEHEEEEDLDTELSAADGVHMQDLVSALHYSFRQEVALHKEIDSTALEALKQYVVILAKYFPGIEPVMVFLGEMRDWIEYQTEAVTGEEWLKIIDGLQGPTAYLPGKLKWVACHGSKKTYRGYPCGLWTLFHTLSINSEDGQDYLEVLHAMKGYITEFFSCEECSKNFAKMAVTMEDQVHSHDDAILWLWQAHNMANKRLHGDASEDPKHPKIQFPGIEICKSCWTTHRGQPIFVEKEVLEFLKSFYGRDNIVFDPDEAQPGDIGPFDRVVDPDNPPVQKQIDDLKEHSLDSNKKKNDLRHSAKVKANTLVMQRIEKLKQLERDTRHLPGAAPVSWGINSMDISMCVLFYVLCTTIIIIVYFHFTVQRKMSCPPCCQKR